MSRVNLFQEGHGSLRGCWDVPKKKRKHRPKGFRYTAAFEKAVQSPHGYPKDFGGPKKVTPR
jgi:hypothetical protein